MVGKLFFAVWALLASYLTAGIARAAEIDQVLADISAAEHRLLNLRVESSIVDETRGGDGKWVATPVGTDATGWLNGMPGGPARIEVHRQISTWLGDDAPAPFEEQSYIAAWNGNVGAFVQLKAGPVGHTGDSMLTTVYSKVPPALNPALSALGTEFSIYLTYTTRSMSMAQLIGQFGSARDKPGWVYKAQPEELNGIKAIRIVVGKADVMEYNYWVDPARSYALLRWEYHSVDSAGKAMNSQSQEITKLVEAAPGIWYPAEAFYYYSTTALLSFDPKNKTPRRRHFIAKSVVANDPHFDNGIFDLKIPPGHTVMDADTGKEHQSGPATRELDDALRQAAEQAKKTASDAK